MNVALRLVLSLTALLGTVSLFAQDSLAVKGMLNDTLVLQNATVTAKSREQKLREGAFAVGALNIRLQASTLQSLTQAIDRSSGIRIREEGGVGSEFDLSINGMSGNSIRYFLDGMPLDAKGTGMTLANLPVNIIERVEIYKGVIPVSFGSDALGGAVNIVTNRSRRNYLDFSYGIGSFHTHKADFNAQYTGKKTGLIFKPVISANYSKNDYLMRDVKVRNEEHTAFVIKDLPRFHDDYLSLFGQMEVGVADRSWADAFFVSASVSKVDKDIQTGATQDRVIGMAERHTQSLNVSARYEKVDFLTDGMQFQISASHTMDHSQTIDTTYRRYYWDGSYIDGSYSEIRSRGKTLRHYHRPLTVVRSNLSYRLAEGHELALNYVFNRAGNRQTDDWDTDFVPTDDVLAKHVAGLSYDQSLLSGRLNNAFFVKDYVNHLMIGQNELPSTTGANVVQGSDTKNYVGYGLGTRYLFFDPLAVKGSYEHSVRLPISRELLGNGSTVYPNVALKPEISENFNVGLFGTVDLGGGHSISYEMNGFVRLVDNYIRATVTETESMMQYVNVAAVHIKGVDGEIRYDWAGKLHVAANASYDDSRDMRKYTQSGDLSVTYRNRTPNRPWTYANTEVSYSFYDVGLRGSRLRLSADYQWVHWFYLTWAAFGSASSKSKVPTQHITNASLLYSWHANRYNVSLECTNLLDALAFDNYMLQKPGRAFFLKFRLFL
ncbi:MAG: TonB-dependent receptor [Bacteroidales bacterium]|nr:TonB-dependent receptor [Bacteroidales bacterium]MBR6869105.1 TonB-dependent receptor [Bacteroidales bacterium]